MALSPGDRLGHYEITAPLGAGGMGEVYRATDTRLEREVAIKVLPEDVASDLDRLARFEREAKVLASLNHPNISTLFGLDTVPKPGPDDRPVTFLAMELVEGEDLSERISRKPIPLKETIAIGRQIAEGLEAAHTAGIIHRDLKPANIRITPDGTVKILDFGLAREWGPSPGDADFTESPTITAELTRAGTILGTAPYLSPEQAVGKPVDRRADIWAFGCVLYEMIAGQRTFAGRTSTEILAHILERDPDWYALPPTAGPELRRLLRRCLEKDPNKRLRDAGDVALSLEDLDQEPPVPAAMGPLSRSSLIMKSAPWLLAAVAVVVAFRMWTGESTIIEPAGTPTLRFTEISPTVLDMSKIGHFGSAVAISPDGHVLAWASSVGETTQLFSRHLDEQKALPVAGTEGAVAPFFSPDGEWIGFWADRSLKKVAVRGGAAQTICPVEHIHGASWGDGTIVLEGTGAGMLSTVDVRTGQLEQVDITSRPDISGGYPKFLPGYSAILVSSIDGGRVKAVSLDSGEVTPLIDEGTNASYLPTGHLVWTHEDKLLAAPFDLSSLEITGAAQTVIEGVLTETGLASHYAVSNEGTLAYLTSTSSIDGAQPVWVHFDGSTEPLPFPNDPAYLSPRISPDGRMVLVSRLAQNRNLWLVDLERGLANPIGEDVGSQFWAIWTRDSADIIFNWQHGAEINLWTRPVNRSRPATRLTTAADRIHVPMDITHDGRTVLFESTQGPNNKLDIYVLDLDGDHAIAPLMTADANLMHPTLSPDDRWLAYASDESGRPEVYVQPFPDLGATFRVSPDGGQEPIWSRSGDRLYYRSVNGRRILAVDILDGETLRLGREVLLLEGNFEPGVRWGRKWDLHPDGTRFLVLHSERPEPPEGIRVVRNWFPELKRLVPTDDRRR